MEFQGLRKLAEQLAGPLGLIGTIGGFVGDVLAPLGSFAPWVAGFSFAVFLLSLVSYVPLRKKGGAELGESYVPMIMVLSAGSAVIFTFWAVVFSMGPERGYLAENVDPIAQIQAQLLGLDEKITEIQETTEETAENVEVIATAQAEGFADIQAAFASLQATQVLVENPTTPQEWYSNARIYHLKGDTANAVKAYEGYFAAGLEYVDPVTEYVALLTSTEGIARARQKVSDLLNQHPDNKVFDMVMATMLDIPEDRITRLENLATRAPEFAPVFEALGREYNRQVIGLYTLEAVEKQQNVLKKVQELEAQQLYSRYFIDKIKAQENLQWVESTLANYLVLEGQQVTLNPYFGPDGLNIAVIIPEAYPQDMFYSLDDPNPSTPAAKFDFNGQQMVNTTIGPIPYTKGEHTVYVKYVNRTGSESEVFSYTYNVNDIMVSVAQLPRDFSTNAIPVNLMLFVVEGNSEDYYTFNYSIDNPSLDQKVEGFAELALITLPNVELGEHTLYVQGIAPDGSETELVEFVFTIQ